MRKISFTKDVWPHLLAVIIFFVVTIIFFSPVFFENRVLSQGDIQQHLSSSKALRDYRDATGEEGLWVSTMFSGMPAYLVNLDWSDGAIVAIKKVLSLFIVHPVCNVFLAFVSFYVLCLSFRVRPYLAIAGALAFGLSSYMIIGLGAGHNARIGAIALMPLVVAGIHLSFSGKRFLGFGVTAGGLALHLRENHMQITYYLVFIVAVYGLVHLVLAARQKQLSAFLKTLMSLVPAAVLAAATFFGQFWAITEYTRYSIRGPSELQASNEVAEKAGLSRGYAFGYGIGPLEPLTLLIPDFFGGNGAKLFVDDQESGSYRALVQAGSNDMANQLAVYTSRYWGGHSPTPYYAGAIVVFLFAVGIAFAERRFVWWIVPLAVISLAMSVGESFSSFNFFLFDYLPGYNKFRSPTFSLIIILFGMPLLGMIGLEKLLSTTLDKSAKRRLLVAVASTGGVCLLFALFAGSIPMILSEEAGLPAWFSHALETDRQGVTRADAIRSTGFIFSIFILLWFEMPRRISPAGFYAFLSFMVAIDLGMVDKRYFTSDNYQRKRSVVMEASAADLEVLKDKSYYRVYNLNEPFTLDGRSSYFHHSINGYHGAKMRRYQDLADSCLSIQLRAFLQDAQQGRIDFSRYGVLNMLNTKYFIYGPNRDDIILNSLANGPAWFVSEVVTVNSPTEELAKVDEIDTKRTALIDISRFKPSSPATDSAAVVTLVDSKPNWMKYQASTSSGGVAVFSEIYYPKGWTATIDGKEVPIMRADYILRAVEVPAGEHVIEFTFAPRPYVIGNKITMIASWLLLIIVIGFIVQSIRSSE